MIRSELGVNLQKNEQADDTDRCLKPRSLRAHANSQATTTIQVALEETTKASIQTDAPRVALGVFPGTGNLENCTGRQP
jgi:hypothetical protein